MWGGCGVNQQRRIQKVINHCARIVFCARKFDHVTPLLDILEWPSVEKLICERDLAMLRRILTHQHAPRRLCDSFTRRDEVSNRDTRGARAGQLQLPRVHTELARRFYSFRAVSSWNASFSGASA